LRKAIPSATARTTGKPKVQKRARLPEEEAEASERQLGQRPSEASRVPQSTKVPPGEHDEDVFQGGVARREALERLPRDAEVIDQRRQRDVQRIGGEREPPATRRTPWTPGSFATAGSSSTPSARVTSMTSWPPSDAMRSRGVRGR